LQDVVDWDLCIGCGACYYACDRGAVSLVNLPTIGIRPRFETEACAQCTQCLEICPGATVDGDAANGGREKISRADREFGPVLEMWEGWAADPEVRRRGSSGGALTALSLYCLERLGMEFVLHTAMDEEMPWMNRTVASRTRAELIDRTGSRYAPSSPCEGLDRIERAERPAVFIGKPCDAAAATMLRRTRPALDRNLGAVLTFFCAGTPSTSGTTEVLAMLDLTPEEIDALRYRGDGWPGRFRALHAQRSREKSMSYRDSWHHLNSRRTLRCHICPDGPGRVADVSCGDAWHRFKGDAEGYSEGDPDDPGQSLVLAHTERGLRIVRGAIEAGYLKLETIDADAIYASAGVLKRRRELFGRLSALRLLGRPIPRFSNFSLWKSWRELSMRDKIRSVSGTVRRAWRRGYWRRRKIDWRRGLVRAEARSARSGDGAVEAIESAPAETSPTVARREIG
jgi:coenzyme F420 hydrogenase subunit beta